MEHLAEILVPIAVCCVLPIMVIWLIVRKRINETNARTQIALAALEKNPDIDIEELLKKFANRGKLLKEKLLAKLLWGCLTTLLGVGLIGFGVYLSANHLSGTDDPMVAVCFGLASLGVGIAFLVNYFVGKKMLAKEIEAEEKRVTLSE